MKNSGLVGGFFRGLNGLGKAFTLVVFAVVLMLLTGNIFTGIILTGIALYVWIHEGDIDTLERRIRRLEDQLQQKSAI